MFKQFLLKGISCLLEQFSEIKKKTSINMIKLYIKPRIYHLQTKLTQEIVEGNHQNH